MKLYEAGASSARISEVIGWYELGVMKVLKKHGVVKRTKGTLSTLSLEDTRAMYARIMAPSEADQDQTAGPIKIEVRDGVRCFQTADGQWKPIKVLPVVTNTAGDALRQKQLREGAPWRKQKPDLYK